MQRIMMILMFMIFVVASSGYADQAPTKKLYRGVVNMLTAPMEIPKQARAYWIKGAQLTPHIFVWIFSGTVWGLVQSVKREGSGFWDIISFPLAKPVAFEPLFKPDFVFDQWPRNPKSGR